MTTGKDEKRPISLKQARELYKYNYTHIEPIGMQEGMNELEFPTDRWVVKALKVGYTQFLNIRAQQQAQQQAQQTSTSQKKKSIGRIRILGHF